MKAGTWTSARGGRALLDDAGAATIEFVLALPLLVSMAAVASELGGAMRVNAQLENAVRDTARILSITPLDGAGNLLANGVDRAFAMFQTRMREAGNDVTFAQGGDGNMTCAAEGSPCVRVEVIPGSLAVFGRDRLDITVSAAVEVDTPLLGLFRDGVERDAFGRLVMRAETTQMHFD